MSILTMLLAVGSFVFFFKVIKNKNHHTSAVLTTLQSKINKKENIETLEKKIAEDKEALSDPLSIATL